MAERSEGQQGSSGYRLVRMWHPSHNVLDLGETEDFFERVFGQTSTNIEVLMSGNPPREGFSNNYSTFTSIRDVLFDSIDPKRFIANGVQRYPTPVKPHLNRLSWYVDGRDEFYRAMRRQGFRFTNQRDEIIDDDEPPVVTGPAANGPLYLLAEDAGLLFSFLPTGPFPLDPRTKPDWVLPPVSDADPLGIEFCSHHTVLTSNPDRAGRLMDALGGIVIHEGRDSLLQATGVYVHLADGIVEYAVPDPGSPAETELSAFTPKDAYHALTWKVVDLDRAERHLISQGVRIQTRSDDTVITDADTSLGIPWGFTTKLVPGDPRSCE
jgi:hypothetical protein